MQESSNVLSKVINLSICKHTFSIRTVRSHFLFSYSLLGLAREKILDCFCCDIVSVFVPVTHKTKGLKAAF